MAGGFYCFSCRCDIEAGLADLARVTS
jgi:hypothetical protein